MRKLEIIGPETLKRTVNLELGEHYIGRVDSVEIPLDIRGISRNHARIDVEESSVTISDLGSLNGTFVNEVEINVHPLHDGDVIRIGPVTMVYHEKLDEVNEKVFVEKRVTARSRDVSENSPASVSSSVDMDIKGVKKERPGIFNAIVSSFGGLTELEVRAKIFAFHLALIFIALFFIFLLILPAYRSLAKREMEQTGKTLTHFLAAINREPLIRGQTVLLDTSSVRQENGVIAAYILDFSGKIIEPATMAGEGDRYSLRALGEDRFFKQETPDGHMIFTVPIKDNTERIGTARVDFEFGALSELNQKTNILLVFGTVLFVLAAAIFSSLTVTTLLQPIDRIKNEIDLVIKENLQGQVSVVKNPVINGLVQALNRLILRAQSTTSAVGSGESARTAKDSPVRRLPENELLDALSFGVMILNGEFKLDHVNQAGRRMLHLKEEKVAVGMHLLEVIEPGTRMSAIMQGVKDISQGVVDHSTWEEDFSSVERGVPLKFDLRTSKNSIGAVTRWIITMTKREEDGSE